MIYLIGGPPKCGKTTLAKRLFRKTGIPWLSCDTLLSIAYSLSPANKRSKHFPWPSIRRKTRRSNDAVYQQYSAKEIIRFYRSTARSGAKAIEAFVASELAEGHDFILEGYALEPRLVEKLQRRYGTENVRCVFLLKHDPQAFVENIHKSETAHDWIIKGTKDPDVVYPLIARMICEYSKRLENEARLRRFTVVNTDSSFRTQLSKALRFLTQ